MPTPGHAAKGMSWSELEDLAKPWAETVDYVHGRNNSQSSLRLFGASESDVRVTLYRDNHGWCPYCQKVWLWLEEKKIPYRVRKVSMFCFGEKEKWYKELVPSGMLPALELDGSLITESDVILQRLEDEFGPLGSSMRSGAAVRLRRLERLLFAAWCRWLCYRQRSDSEEQYSEHMFTEVLAEVNRVLQRTPGPFFMGEFSTVDCIFVPYLERMAASLFYYKGLRVRDSERFPAVAAWFEGLEQRPTYLGTQADFHTHVHDLPPQMGGCYASKSEKGMHNRHLVDEGPWQQVPDTSLPDNEEVSQAEVLARICKHRRTIAAINPCDDALVDEALRIALSNMVTNASVAPPPGSDLALRYIRDRISVPRDMSVHAAKHARAAMERTAALAGTTAGPPLPTQHRRDQSPVPFATAAAAAAAAANA